METTRQNKISRLLQKELSEIFLLQTKAMPGVLVSVSAVRISPDMSIARVYLSIFPSEKSEEMVKNINNNMKSIRFELGTRVRHQLREPPLLHSPAISFLKEKAQCHQYHFCYFCVWSGIGYDGDGVYTFRIQRFSGYSGRSVYCI